MNTYLIRGEGKTVGKVLLIGNGINRLGSNLSWRGLLEQLVNYIGKASSFSIDNKPFPILYEEILLRGLKYSSISEKDLINKVSELALDLSSNSYHSQIYDLGLTDIITTNYDYSIENQYFGYSPNSYKAFGDRHRETKYRLFTHIEHRGHRFWHIHGEANFPSTIVLGHDMYSRVLEKQLDYIEKNDVINKELESWIDLFFSHDIHIVGLELDYTEIDLWWLLNYRARLVLNKKIKNKIIYHRKFNNKDKKFIGKREVLEAHAVTIKDHEADNYAQFYDLVFKEIRS